MYPTYSQMVEGNLRTTRERGGVGGNDKANEAKCKRIKSIQEFLMLFL